MINITELNKNSPDTSLIKRLSLLKSIDLYLAESMEDYLINAPKINYPKWKRLVVPNLASIVIFNIGIRAEFDERTPRNYDKFVVHDYTGEDLMYWMKGHNLFPSENTFEEVQREQGLKEDDFVYSIYFGYHIEANCPFIYKVTKYKKRIAEEEKDSVFDKIRKFIPEPELLPQTI